MQNQQMLEALEAARLEIERLNNQVHRLINRNILLEAENKTLKDAQSSIPETVGIVN